MTEREKMLSGELYDPTDKELEQLRVNARKLAKKYNSTDEDDQEEQAQILRELLPATEELPYLQAPVYFDYGCNTFFGKFSSANYGFYLAVRAFLYQYPCHAGLGRYPVLLQRP